MLGKDLGLELFQEILCEGRESPVHCGLYRGLSGAEYVGQKLAVRGE